MQWTRTKKNPRFCITSSLRKTSTWQLSYRSTRSFATLTTEEPLPILLPRPQLCDDCDRLYCNDCTWLWFIIYYIIYYTCVGPVSTSSDCFCIILHYQSQHLLTDPGLFAYVTLYLCLFAEFWADRAYKALKVMKFLLIVDEPWCLFLMFKHQSFACPMRLKLNKVGTRREIFCPWSKLGLKWNSQPS